MNEKVLCVGIKKHYHQQFRAKVLSDVLRTLFIKWDLIRNGMHFRRRHLSARQPDGAKKMI